MVVGCRSVVSQLIIRLREQQEGSQGTEPNDSCLLALPILNCCDSVHFVLVLCSVRPWLS